MKKENTCFIVLLTVFIFLFNITAIASAQQARMRVSDIKKVEDDISDIRAEVLFGRDLAARILSNFPLIKDDALNSYVNLVGRAVSLSAGRPELPFYFGVLKSDEINAYATPGGYIFITKAAFDALENEAQLACILSHEIAHVIEKHVVKELDIKGEEGSALSGLAALIGGATGSFSKALEKSLLKAEDILFKRGYKKKDELSADTLGVTLTALTGYDPSEFITVLKRIQSFEEHSENKSPGHPFAAERIGQISDLILSQKLNANTNYKGEKRFYEFSQKQ